MAAIAEQVAHLAAAGVLARPVAPAQLQLAAAVEMVMRPQLPARLFITAGAVVAVTLLAALVALEGLAVAELARHQVEQQTQVVVVVAMHLLAGQEL